MHPNNQNVGGKSYFASLKGIKKRLFALEKPLFFILGLFLLFGKLSQDLWAWNPDYAYPLPRQREFCAKRDSKETWLFRPLGLQEVCEKNESHYLAVFAKEPRGAIALIKLSKYQGFFPKPGIKWPPEASQPDQGLWHFSCLGEKTIPVFDTEVRLRVFLGDLTAPSSQSCEASKKSAQDFCQKKLKGQEILESCAGYW
ncbi:MAG: hypothetical protein KDK66_03800 [Deltaproteobacteria bacterium]|nr:hypothetical protein [Deltaproteobacteria bacterium]